MCIKCHQGLSNETIRQQMNDALENPFFEKWNSTSVSHLFITYSGVNGSEAQEVAGQLLQNLIHWSRENKITHVDCLGRTRLSPIDNIEKCYIQMKNCPNLRIEESEIPARKEAVFHGDFLQSYLDDLPEPEESDVLRELIH